VSTLTGTGSLVKLSLRRDRIMIVIWLYALTAFVAATVYGFKKLYPTSLGIAGFASSASHNPALLSLYGPLFGDSLGTLTAWRDAAVGSTLMAVMSIFIVIRHTRADEESGRLELIGSAPVGRHAALASAVIVAIYANIAIFVLMSVAAIALGLPAAGSIALAGGMAGSGLVFTGVAAVTAQLTESARAARGLAFVVVGVTFLLRAVGDSASATGPRWLSWLSPMGWAELNRAFGVTSHICLVVAPGSCPPNAGPRWWVLALPVLTFVVVAVIAALLADRRDYAAGLLPQRPGPARAGGTLRSPYGLAWRLQRATVLSWAGAGLVYGVVLGSSAKGIGGLLNTPELKKIVARMGGQAGLSNAYLAAILGLCGLLATGFAISSVLRLRAEETDERADSVLATGTGRVSWGSSHVAIALGGTVLIMLMTGLGAGLGYTYRAGGGGAEIGRLVLAGLAQVPAALVLGGLAVALFGLVPKASAAASWSVLGAAVLMALVGATLQLSHWVMDVSPFTHAPKLPGGAVSAAPLLWLSAIAVVLAAVGLIGLRTRDIE
jgi:ABC-2 type transport system permease protein